MKEGLARPCSLKKGFHKGGSTRSLFGPNCLVPPFGGTCEGGGPSALTVLGGGKFGGPAGGENDEGKDATVEGRGGTGGTGGALGGSINTFFGIDPIPLA